MIHMRASEMAILWIGIESNYVGQRRIKRDRPAKSVPKNFSTARIGAEVCALKGVTTRMHGPAFPPPHLGHPTHSGHVRDVPREAHDSVKICERSGRHIWKSDKVSSLRRPETSRGPSRPPASLLRHFSASISIEVNYGYDQNAPQCELFDVELKKPRADSALTANS